MCFDRDSMPPIPAIAGAAIIAEDLVLKARRRQAEFAAFAADRRSPTAQASSIMPDVRGLFTFYEELALRFAEGGHAAVTIDYFGRTAGVSERNDDFRSCPRWMKTHPDHRPVDVAPAVEYLGSPAGGKPLDLHGRVLLRRSASWRAAAAGHGLAGAIGFYGRPGPGADGSPGPRQRARALNAPILGLMGGADAAIPLEEVERVRTGADGGRHRARDRRSTKVRRTASSTGSRRSSRTRRPMRGAACSASSSGIRVRWSRGARTNVRLEAVGGGTQILWATSNWI